MDEDMIAGKRIPPDPDGKPYDRMDAVAADKECGTRKGFYGENCKVCGYRVILHCDKCNIQVTACSCFLRERDKSNTAERIDRAVSESEHNSRLREQLESRGVWLPGSNQN